MIKRSKNLNLFLFQIKESTVFHIYWMLLLEVRLGESFSIAKNSVSILMVIDILVVIACKFKNKIIRVFFYQYQRIVYILPPEDITQEMLMTQNMYK